MELILMALLFPLGLALMVAGCVVRFSRRLGLSRSSKDFLAPALITTGIVLLPWGFVAMIVMSHSH
jgi:hypothetical protein